MYKRLFPVLLCLALLLCGCAQETASNLSTQGNTEPITQTQQSTEAPTEPEIIPETIPPLDPEVTYYLTGFVTEYADGTAIRTEYLYDEVWQLACIVNYDGEEEYSSTEYVYDGDITYITSVSGGMTTSAEEHHTWDADDRILKTVQMEDGMVITTTEYTYDAHGNVLTSVSYSELTGMTFRTEYTYDENGNQTRVFYDYGSGMTSATETTYDSQGRPLTQMQYQDGELFVAYNCTYSDDGLTAEMIQTDAAGTVLVRQMMTYDILGNLLAVEYYDTNGSLLQMDFYTYTGTDGNISSGMAG